MTELHVRNIPPELRDEIARIAREEGRSMSAQVTVLLREATQLRRPGRTPAEAAARLRERRLKYPVPAGTAAELIREDRDVR